MSKRGIEELNQYYKNSGKLNSFVDERGELRWAPTPYGLWTLLLRAGKKHPIHKFMAEDLELLRMMGFIHRQKLSNGRSRWWPTAKGFKAGLGAKWGLASDAIKWLTGGRGLI